MLKIAKFCEQSVINSNFTFAKDLTERLIDLEHVAFRTDNEDLQKWSPNEKELFWLSLQSDFKGATSKLDEEEVENWEINSFAKVLMTHLLNPKNQYSNQVVDFKAIGRAIDMAKDLGINTDFLRELESVYANRKKPTKP